MVVNVDVVVVLIYGEIGIIGKVCDLVMEEFVVEGCLYFCMDIMYIIVDVG